MQKFTEDCIFPNYGSVNKDGYVRVLNKSRKEGGRLVMFHRKMWEEYFGQIPTGFEINHKCKNRKCCNITHLECLSISEHRAKDNAIRYKERETKILSYVKDNPLKTQEQVAEMFGVSQAGVSLILKRNRRN